DMLVPQQYARWFAVVAQLCSSPALICDQTESLCSCVGAFGFRFAPVVSASALYPQHQAVPVEVSAQKCDGPPASDAATSDPLTAVGVVTLFAVPLPFCGDAPQHSTVPS